MRIHSEGPYATAYQNQKFVGVAVSLRSCAMTVFWPKDLAWSWVVFGYRLLETNEVNLGGDWCSGRYLGTITGYRNPILPH